MPAFCKNGGLVFKLGFACIPVLGDDNSDKEGCLNDEPDNMIFW